MSNCDVCGKGLKLGEFAYDQKTCWECFDAAINTIIYSYDLSLSEIILLLRMKKYIAEIHGIKVSYDLLNKSLKEIKEIKNNG